MEKENIDSLINIEKYLIKHDFIVEHFVESIDWEEHLAIYDNAERDIYKVSVNEENIVLQSYCSVLRKTFAEKAELKEFLKKDIKQYL